MHALHRSLEGNLSDRKLTNKFYFKFFGFHVIPLAGNDANAPQNKLKDIQRQVEICKLTASLVRENAALVAVTIKSKGFCQTKCQSYLGQFDGCSECEQVIRKRSLLTRIYPVRKHCVFLLAPPSIPEMPYLPKSKFPDQLYAPNVANKASNLTIA